MNKQISIFIIRAINAVLYKQVKMIWLWYICSYKYMAICVDLQYYKHLLLEFCTHILSGHKKGMIAQVSEYVVLLLW